MSSRYVVLCGVPDQDCVGSKYITDQSLPKKCHASRADAFQCMVRHLIKLGFTRVGPREFVNPENGRVRVLSKQSHFGAVLRTGKEGNRFQPERGAGLIN